jgi:hypothetical protein
VPPVTAERYRRLLADLDSDDFATRERAGAELGRSAEAAEGMLRRTLAGLPSLEVRRRIERLLARRAAARRAPEWLRPLRGVQVLEHIGTPEARRVLATLAEGTPQARLTQEARAALRRLARRAAARHSEPLPDPAQQAPGGASTCAGKDRAGRGRNGLPNTSRKRPFRVLTGQPGLFVHLRALPSPEIAALLDRRRTPDASGT